MQETFESKAFKLSRFLKNETHREHKILEEVDLVQRISDGKCSLLELVQFYQVHLLVHRFYAEKKCTDGRFITLWSDLNTVSEIEKDLAMLSKGLDKVPSLPCFKFASKGHDDAKQKLGIASEIGIAYVLIGSILGGKVIGQRLNIGSLRFFIGNWEKKLGTWKEFLQRVDQIYLNESEISLAKAAARNVFRQYHQLFSDVRTESC